MMDNDKIIVMHDTWLAIDAINGCTNGCKYCVLREDDSNMCKPKVKVEPEEAIQLLLLSKYYDKEIPICLLPGTDAFLNQENINYTKRLLELLMIKKVKNPIVLVTKCLIPDDFIDFIEHLREKGMEIIVYLSYSGLGKKYEPRINHEAIKENFVRLTMRGIKVIHYYRPFLPDNSASEDITNVLDFVSKYTNISVITGLKLKPTFIDKMDFCKVTKAHREECLNASGIWPKRAYDYFYKDYKHRQNVFQTNYCALAQLLGRPCSQFYGTLECKEFNHCSLEQRKLCASFKRKENVSLVSDIKDLLHSLGINSDKIEIVKEGNEVLLKNASELSVSDVAYLTYKLGYKVSLEKKSNGDPRFASQLSNGKPFVYEENENE